MKESDRLKESVNSVWLRLLAWADALEAEGQDGLAGGLRGIVNCGWHPLYEREEWSWRCILGTATLGGCEVAVHIFNRIRQYQAGMGLAESFRERNVAKFKEPGDAFLALAWADADADRMKEEGSGHTFRLRAKGVEPGICWPGSYQRLEFAWVSAVNFINEATEATEIEIIDERGVLVDTVTWGS